MSAEVREGQLTAWLQKKKSGTAVVRVRQYNKRFFTLDFDSRVFFYSHAEGSKKASTVIPFPDILDVKLSADAQAAVNSLADTASECSRTSKVSLMKRMSSFGRKADEEQEQHGLVVLLRPAKQMELMCASANEAIQWFEALRSAIDSAKGAGGAPGAVGAMTSGGSTGTDDSPRRGASGGEGGEAAGASGGYPGRGGAGGAGTAGYPDGRGGPPLAPTGLASGKAAGGIGGAGGEDDEEGAPATPPEKRSFLDFGTIEEEEAEGGAGARVAGAGGVVEEASAVSATGLVTFEAADFGFGADEDRSSDSGSSSSSSAPASPRPAAAAGDVGAAGAGSAKNAAGAADASSPEGVSPGAGAAGAAGGASAAARASPASGRRSGGAGYADRHEGLTLQERLANLEFSDDEDEEDDDDPLGLKKGGSTG